MTDGAVASLLLGHGSDGHPVRGMIVGDDRYQTGVGVVIGVSDMRRRNGCERQQQDRAYARCVSPKPAERDARTAMGGSYSVESSRAAIPGVSCASSQDHGRGAGETGRVHEWTPPGARA